MNRVLIADAGSSKTNWSFLSEKSGEILRFDTSGINPVHDSEERLGFLVKEIKQYLPEEPINEIHFFGAGCATSDLKQKVSDSFHEFFKDVKIHVESDLLGAALALFGDKEGIACILGTGSNTGLYSNGQIQYQIPSLGYILGDEGGGVSLGKTLLNAIFKKQLSEEIIKNFFIEYNITLQDLINKVYKGDKPAAYLASFSPFLLKNIGQPEIRELVKKEFDNFIKKNILSYPDYQIKKLGFVGSIAYNYKEILEESASNFSLKIYSIIPKPIIGLENFFIQK